MLTQLRIDNILLMDELQVDFDCCLTAITGQTGAGKSILLDSIGIILGKRAETSILRNPAKQGVIVATFEINKDEIANILYENGFLNSEQETTLIIKKIITKNGSKIFINDIQTTVQFVNSIAGHLLEIYSQFEQTDLFSIKKHLAILDKFSHLDDDLKICKNLFIKSQEADEQYEATKAEIERQKENMEYLQDFIQDVEALHLEDGEYDKLLATRKQMVDNEKIATYIKNAYDCFLEAKIGNIVNKTQDNLQKAEGTVADNNNLKGTFFAINEALESVYTSSQMAEELLSDFATKNYFDDEELNEIEERISAINEIARKYQTTPYELTKQYELAMDKLKKISFSDEVLAQLSKIATQAKNEYLNIANQLHEKRKENAIKLEQLVISKLQNLKMDKVQFYTQFEQIDPTETGTDKVVFFASMNTGLAPSPIHKIASGGELSRFMLAFKSALCTTQNTSTIIFDEIDTGVSGNVAFAIGQEMKHLSSTTQVICITHNAQTASCANNHFFVSKEQNLDIAKTIIKKLTNEERIRTIAEMISCDEITEEALKNAEKLLEKAK